MNVLALDTTSRAGSAAFVADGRILVVRQGDGTRSHGERLPSELLRVLEQAGVDLQAVELFAVAAGPGSFTGLRVGIATIQGLAFTTGRPVAPVSALEALAQSAAATRRLAPGTIVGAWVDAYRGEVFSALYRVQEAVHFSRDRLSEIDGPSAGRPVATLDRWTGQSARPDVLVGDGVLTYADVVKAYDDRIACLPPPMLAGAIGLMGASLAEGGGTVSPAEVRPLYVRRPDAEVMRDAAFRAGSDPVRAGNPPDA